MYNFQSERISYFNYGDYRIKQIKSVNNDEVTEKVEIYSLKDDKQLLYTYKGLDYKEAVAHYLQELRAKEINTSKDVSDEKHIRRIHHKPNNHKRIFYPVFAVDVYPTNIDKNEHRYVYVGASNMRELVDHISDIFGDVKVKTVVYDADNWDNALYNEKYVPYFNEEEMNVFKTFAQKENVKPTKYDPIKKTELFTTNPYEVLEF